MNLGARLETVLALAAPAPVAADIGTDHAYLAIELLRRRIARRVIASDKNAAPCEAARRGIAAANLPLGESGGEISVRQGDGLAALKPGEAQEIFIAGLGGALMINILKESENYLTALKAAMTQDCPRKKLAVSQLNPQKGLNMQQNPLPAYRDTPMPRLVLQPQSDIPAVRRYLYSSGWRIAAEKIAEENGHFYVAFAAEPAAPDAPPPDEREIIVGRYDFSDEATRAIFPRYRAAVIARLERAVSGMERAAKADAAPDLARYRRELSVWAGN